MASTGSADATLRARTALSVTDTTAATDGPQSQARLSGAAGGSISVGTGGEDKTAVLQGAVEALNLDSASSGPVAPGTQRPPSAGEHMALARPISLFVRLTSGGKHEVVDVQGPLVGHAKDAVMAKFSQRFKGIDPDQVDLVLDNDASGRALEPTQSLLEAHIHAYTKLRVVVNDANVVQARPALSELPTPVTFELINLGGEDWFRAMLPLERGQSAPVYLTREQHGALQRFILELPSQRPQVLMPVGTIKSGKSTILARVLPGMLAAQYEASWPATRLRPVVFCYQFPLGATAEAAAVDMQDALVDFADRINVPYRRAHTPSAALNNLPRNLEQFAAAIKDRAGELWLCLDELQGPGLGSTPADAQRFTYKFKQIVEYVSPHGRVVVTGSGLVALLNSFRTTHVNGFALWDAVSFVSLGREPSRAVAQLMAEALLPPYAAHWPAVAKATITPEAVLRVLAPDAHGGLTSQRPALVAYVLGRMGDAHTGTANEVLQAAVKDALGKLKAESTRDTLSTLVSLDGTQRSVLRAVAAGSYTCAGLEAIRTAQGPQRFLEGDVGLQPEKLAALITCLREEGDGDDPVSLQPPYSALLQSWIRTGGELAVQLEDGKIDLDYATRKNLVFIAEPSQRNAVQTAGLHGAVSVSVLSSLARNGIGVRTGSTSVRPPASAAEFDAVPAFRHLKGMLSAAFLAGIDKKEPSLSKALSRAAAASGAAVPAGARFEECIGWELLLAFRHFEAHIWANAEQLVGNGLTAAVVADAMYAATCVVVDPTRGCFRLAGGLLGPR